MAHISTAHPMSLIVLVAWLLLFDISSSVQPAIITGLLPVYEIQPLLSSATREIATSRATLAATVANLGEIAASLESMKRGDDVKAIESVLDQAANSIRAVEDAQKELSLFRKADRKEALEQSVQKLHFAIQDVDKYKQVFEQVDSESKPYDDQLSKLIKSAYKDEIKGDFEQVHDDIATLKALLFVKYNSKKVEEQNELNISETKDKLDQGLASLSVQGASDKDQVEAVRSDDPTSPKINSEGRIKRAVHTARNALRMSKARRVSLGRKLLTSNGRRRTLEVASSVLIGLSLGGIVDRILKRLTPEYVHHIQYLTEPAEDVYNNQAFKYPTVQEQFGSTPPFVSANPWFKYSTGQFGQFGSTPSFVYNRQVRQSELDTSVVGYYTKIVVIGVVAVAILVSIVAGLAYYLLVGRKPKTSSSKNQDSGSSKSATSSSSAFTEKGPKTLGSKNP